MNIPGLIYEIAMAEQEKSLRTKDYYYGELDFSPLARPLKELALTVKGPEILTDEAVLLTFFTPSGLARLLNAPNLYWFWTVLMMAIVEHARSLAEDEFALVESARIEETFASLREHLNYDYGLDRHHETLNAAETAAWVAEGLLLVHITGERKIKLVRNYIFQSASSHKQRLVAA